MGSLFGRCTNIWTLLVLFSMCYFLETITFTYLISAIQSIERQFQIPSRMSGGLVASSDIGYILTVVVLAYFGSRGNRARWIGSGCMLISFACFLIALPNFIYRTKPSTFNNTEWQSVPVVRYHEVNAPAKLINHPVIGCPLRRCWQINDKAAASLSSSSTSSEYGFLSCDAVEIRGRSICDERLWSLGTHFRLNETNSTFITRYDADPLLHYFNEEVDWITKRQWLRSVKATTLQPFAVCNRLANELKQANDRRKCEVESTNTGAFTMMIMGMIFYGVGHSMPWTLGVPLIDDNVKKRSTPLYFAFIFFIRIMGPVLGFVIGSGCNKLYYDLKNELNLVHTDPSWIGAWWLGFLLISACLFPPSALLICFPDLNSDRNRGTPKSAKTATRSSQEQTSLINNGTCVVKNDTVYKECVTTNGSKNQSVTETLRDFICAIRQVLRSPVYTACLIGRLFDAFAFKGFFVFQPKYLENHYGVPQYKANMFLGVAGILGFALGVIVGSIILRRYRLKGRKAALFVAVCTITSSLLAFSKILLACQSTVNQLGSQGSLGNLNFTNACVSDCSCDGARLFPVCSHSGQVYYSPCHAGCRDYQRFAEKLNFTNCKCIDEGTTVSRSFCRDDCHVPLILYFLLITISGIIGGCSVIPGVLILLRSVPHSLRSVALGLSGFLVSLISTFPSPIVYGLIIDSACILWNNVCGQHGACNIYDSNQIRFRYFAFNGCLRLGGLVLDVVVWYYAKGLVLIGNEEEISETAEAAPGTDKQRQKRRRQQLSKSLQFEANALHADMKEMGSTISLGV